MPADVVRTERLIIRPWTHSPADVDRIFDTYSRWEVARWLGATPRALASRDEAELAVDRWAARTNERWGLGLWAVEVRETGVVAGSVLLVTLPPATRPAGPGEGADEGFEVNGGADHPAIEVGWHFHPDSWHNGYATEAAREVLARGFATGLTEVYAVLRPDNGPSAAVCRRLGMAPLGRTTRWYDTELEVFRTRAGQWVPSARAETP
jgi:RimJ/RimL family protein N-acetyltransferase